MIQPVYKRDANEHYMILKEEAMDREEQFQEKMLLENEIAGLLPVSLHTFNGERQFYYQISGKQTLSCLYEKRQIKAADLEMILLGLEKIFSVLENFFLDGDYLLLSPEYIYLNLSKKQVNLCFCPFAKGDLQRDLENLATYFLEHIDHAQNEVVVPAYQFYRLVKEGSYAFAQVIKEVFPQDRQDMDCNMQTANQPSLTQCDFTTQDLEQNTDLVNQARLIAYQPSFAELEYDTTAKKDYGKPKVLYYLALLAILAGSGYGFYGYFLCFLPTKGKMGSFLTTGEFMTAAMLGLIGLVLLGFSLFFYRAQKKQEKEKVVVERCVDELQLKEFAGEEGQGWEKESELVETFVQEEQTILLAENCYEEERCLVSLDKHKTKIFLSEFPFVVGKLEGMTDYIIQDRSVSRIHARFLYDEQQDTVFLEDLNSANGTFKNGVRLESSQKVPVYAQDEIRFGKKVFVYQ